MGHRECQHCGSALDPQERCDCLREKDKDEDAPLQPERPQAKHGFYPNILYGWGPGCQAEI